METHYLELEERIGERRKHLNVLYWLRISATFSLSITFLYLVFTYLGAVQMLEPWWIFPIFNVVAIAMGWLIGRSRPTKVKNDLFRIDRAFRLGEKLTTIHYLREIRTSPVFLEALYRKVESLRINPQDALRLSERDQKGWFAVGGLFFASLLVLFLWTSGLNPGSAFWGTGSPMGQSPYQNSLLLNQDRQEELDDPMSNLTTDRESDAATSDESQEECEPGSAVSSELPRSGRNDIFVQNECTGDEDASGLDELGQNEQRETRPNSLSQELASLLAQLLNGQMSPEDVRRDLQQLAGQLPPGAMQDMLDELSELGNVDELIERLQDAFDEALANEEEGNNPLAQNNSENGDSNSSSQDGEMSESFGSDFLDASAPNPFGSEGSSSSSSSSSSGSSMGEPSSGTSGEPGSESASGTGSGESEGENSDESVSQAGGQGESSDESQTAGQAEGETGSSGQAGQSSPDSGGEGVGQAPGEARASAGESPEIEAGKNVYISSDQLPGDAEMLQKLMTMGLPVDLEGEQTTSSTQIRFNADRVEALMELRDLPPQLRALVRTYFLAITGER